MSNQCPQGYTLVGGACVPNTSGGGGSQTPWTSNIDGGGHVLADVSKVGVGTTAPLYVIHQAVVQGGLAPSLTYNSTGPGGPSGIPALGLDVPGNAEIVFAWTGASPYGYWIQARAQNSTAIPICLQPSGGDVGIGTTVPTSPLHVANLPTYASDTLAGTGGLTSGAFYKDSTGGLHVKL